MKPIFIILLFIFSVLMMVKGHALDTATNSSSSPHADSLTTVSNVNTNLVEDDISPGMAFFILVGIGFVCICIGVGIVITVIGLTIIFGLISIGILSASVIVGINKRSFARGFRMFLVLSSAVVGLIVCSVGFWLLNKIMYWGTAKTAILLGACCGIVAGIVFGFLGFIILQRLTTYFKKKLNIN